MRFELAGQPRAREPPLGSHRALRDAECFRRLLDGESEQAAQLDDPRLALALGLELLERRIDGEQIDAALLIGEARQRDALRVIAAALLRLPLARAIDEDLPHRERCRREEVLAVARV